MSIPHFMANIAKKINETPIHHGNYPTIPNRPTADAPWSPRSAITKGHKTLPAKAGKGHKVKGSGQAKAQNKGHK